MRPPSPALTSFSPDWLATHLTFCLSSSSTGRSFSIATDPMEIRTQLASIPRVKLEDFVFAVVTKLRSEPMNTIHSTADRTSAAISRTTSLAKRRPRADSAAGEPPGIVVDGYASPWDSGCSLRGPRRHPFQLGALLDREHDWAGFVTINGFTFLDNIGTGAFGSVWVVQDSKGEKFAMKTIKRATRMPAAESRQDLSEADAGPMADDTASGTGYHMALSELHDDVRREIVIMKRLKHKNIVPLFEVIDDKENKQLLLRMKYVPHGPIITLLRDGTCTPIDEATALGYLRQIAAGLSYLHTHKVVHRDIKPSNLLIERGATEDIVYITDFGVSEVLQAGGLCTGPAARRGTPAFFAPELLLSDASEVPGTGVDMWALGVTFYCMVVGRHPFFAPNAAEMEHLILYHTIAFPEGLSLTPETKRIITSLLERDPSKRLTSQQLREMIRAQRTKLRIERVILQEHSSELLSPVRSFAPDSEMPPVSDVELDAALSVVVKREYTNQPTVPPAVATLDI